MKFRRSVVAGYLVTLFSFLMAWPAAADTSQAPLPHTLALTFKAGSFDMEDSDQYINGASRHFEAPHHIGAIEVEGWIGAHRRISLGGEHMSFSSRFMRHDATNYTHKLTADVYSAKAKYFFGSANDIWRPYTGIGVGRAEAEDNSGNNGPLASFVSGPAYQAIAGMQVRARRVGMRLEYVYLHSRLGAGNHAVDISGQAVFVGVNFFIGRSRAPR